jgi:hypothetical protein
MAFWGQGWGQAARRGVDLAGAGRVVARTDIGLRLRPSGAGGRIETMGELTERESAVSSGPRLEAVGA